MRKPISLRQIEVFRAVMECQTTTSASQRLNLSQPTISEHLSSLENATALKLFLRKKNRLTPTPIAEAFYSEILRVYSGVEHLERFIQGLENEFRGQIDFGIMPMVAYQWMPDIVAQFLKTHKPGSISMPVRSSRQILEWVAADRLDFGIVLAEHKYPQVKFEELLRIPLVCLFPKESRYSEKNQITWADLEGKTLVRLRSFDTWTVGLEKIFEQQSRVKNQIETYVTQTAAQIAISCRGYALVDLMSALEMMDDSMDWRPFATDNEFIIHLARPLGRRHSDEVESLIALIREDAKGLSTKFQSMIRKI